MPMRYLYLALVWACVALLPETILAWAGFDSDSTDLIDITPDEVPAIGDTVTARNHDADTTEDCLVMSVKRNSRTIELVVRCGDGRERLLVMEGR